MDGTLVDSSSIIYKTINYVRHNLGLDKLEKDTILQLINQMDINPAKALYNTDTFTPLQEQLFKEYYTKNCLDSIKLYDNILKLLSKLKSDGYKMSIATNAYFVVAKQMLNYLEIDKYFDYIIGADNVKNVKPHPDMIDKLIQNYNIYTDEAIVVGDSYKDLQSAIDAKTNFIMVNWGFANYNKNDYAIIANDTKTLYENICNYSNL